MLPKKLKSKKSAGCVMLSKKTRARHPSCFQEKKRVTKMLNSAQKERAQECLHESTQALFFLSRYHVEGADCSSSGWWHKTSRKSGVKDGLSYLVVSWMVSVQCMCLVVDCQYFECEMYLLNELRRRKMFGE